MVHHPTIDIVPQAEAEGRWNSWGPRSQPGQLPLSWGSRRLLANNRLELISCRIFEKIDFYAKAYFFRYFFSVRMPPKVLFGPLIIKYRWSKLQTLLNFILSFSLLYIFLPLRVKKLSDRILKVCMPLSALQRGFTRKVSSGGGRGILHLPIPSGTSVGRSRLGRAGAGRSVGTGGRRWRCYRGRWGHFWNGQSRPKRYTHRSIFRPDWPIPSRWRVFVRHVECLIRVFKTCYTTMVTYCGAACRVWSFELLPLLQAHILYLSTHSIIAQNNTSPCNDIIKHVCINCI